MKRPLILAAVVALAIGLLTLGGVATRDAAPSTHAQGAATPTPTASPTASPSPSPSPAASPVASPTTTSSSTTTATCNRTTLGEPRMVTGATSITGLAKDCDTLLGLRYTLSRPETLNWSVSEPLTRWNGVTVTPAAPARVVNGVTIVAAKPARVTKLELAPYAFRGALAELVKLDALVELKLTVHTTRKTKPDTPKTTETTETTLSGPTCTRTTLDESPTVTDSTSGAVVFTDLARDCNTLLKIKSTLAQKNPNAPADPAKPDPLGSWGPESALSTWTGVEVDVARKRVTGLKLTSLGLKGTIPPQIGELTALEVLDLRGNQLTGSIPTQLGKLTALTKLILGPNYLSGPIPTQLGNLVNLESLKLNVNRLSGPLPTQLGNLANLKVLQLSGNQLSGSIPTQLGNLTNLKLILLRHNRFSGGIPPFPDGDRSLTSVHLKNNSFTGCVPGSLSAAASNDIAELGLPTCPTTTN